MHLLLSISLMVTILVSGSRTGAEAPQSAPAPRPSKLYTDEEIRKLTKQDIDKVTGKVEALLQTPSLDVVPVGMSYPRAQVFKALHIDDARIRDFRHSQRDFVILLYWQVSQSYDIFCMSGTNDPSNEGLALTDPQRRVYGIRLVKRAKSAASGRTRLERTRL